MRTTAADVKAALLKHYAPPGWRVFFEVSNDTGARARRHIDAVALGIWPSTGHEIIGIEIKVSRGDFLRELKQPEKAQALMKFCTRWCIACPADLVTVDEVPANWGILALQPNGTIRRKKAPSLLEPEPLTAGFMMAVLRNGEAVDSALVERLSNERAADLTAQFEDRVERAVRSRVADTANKTKKALEIAETLKAITGEEISTWSFDPQACAAAYLFFQQSGLHRSVGLAWGGLADLAGQLDKAGKRLAAMHDNPAFVALRSAIEASDGEGAGS